MSGEGFWAKLHAFVSEIDRRSYYEVLRVHRAASTDAIQEQFYRWAPRLHPDRYAREEDPRRQWELSLLYARMREAYRVLSDPVKRRAYDEGLARGQLRMDENPGRRVPAPEMPENEQARRFYKLGLEQLRAGKLGDARLQLEMALQMEPDSRPILEALEKAGGAPERAQARHAPAPPAAAKPPPPAAAKPPPRRVKRAAPAGRVQTPRARMPKVQPVGEIAPIVGIDFGTTRSSVSVAIGEHVFTLPDQRGRTLHPSVVHYRDNGLAVCGWEARQMLYQAPSRTVGSPKRLLGKRFSDPQVAGMLHEAPWKATAGPGDTIVIEMKGVRAAIAQVCAEVVSHVRDVAEKRIGRRIERAVLSVPVSFGEGERQAVAQMARVAGIEIEAFVEEPVAAAMAYGFGKGKNEIVAVYDFGGGTFDFTVIDLAGYHFEVLTSGGDSWLGGDDFDQTMARAVANALWRATGIDVHNRQVEMQRLMFACEQAKRELSLRTETQIVCDRLIEHPRLINLRQKLSREQLEQLTRTHFDQSIQICRRALDRVGLDPADIDQVVASGGVSYMPFVREGLSAFFGREVTPSVNPDEAICLGAGFRAAQLSGRPVRGAARM